MVHAVEGVHPDSMTELGELRDSPTVPSHLPHGILKSPTLPSVKGFLTYHPVLEKGPDRKNVDVELTAFAAT